MKMAAAEALYESVPAGEGAPFSVLTVGSLDGQHANALIEIPGLLSFLATGDFNGAVQGIVELKEQYAQAYGATGNPLVADVATNYVPNIPTTYWTFRLMIGVGMAAAAIALAVLWLTRQGRTPTHRWLLWAAVAAPLLPVLGNSFGWIFTEVGRQPWIVFGLMTTSAGVSPASPSARSSPRWSSSRSSTEPWPSSRSSSSSTTSGAGRPVRAAAGPE